MSNITAIPLQRVPLADLLVEVRTGFASGENTTGGILQLRMHNVTSQGVIDWTAKRRVPLPYRGLNNLALCNGDILFNATNSPELVGKSIHFLGYEEPVTFSNHFLRLRTIREIADSSYISHFLRWHFTLGTFRGMSRQWVNQASINKDQLAKMLVPLPELEEQRRIAAILDQAEALRTKRRQALAKLDTLTQSLFLEMFGDPLSNSRHWPLVSMKELGEVITGNTPPRSKSHFFGNDIEWIKSDNLNTPYSYLTRATEGLSCAGIAVARVAPAGSILVTCIAGSPECIGNAAMADRSVAFNQQINALVPVQGNLHFLYCSILACKSLIQAASTKGMKGMVSKSRFEKVRVPFPPLSLQEAFSKQFSAIHSLQVAELVSSDHSDLVFASLQHRAFNGEL